MRRVLAVAVLAGLATTFCARPASATCALGACIDARPTWTGNRETPSARPEKECPACDEANRQAAAAAEDYALSHIPEPTELPRADTVAEREQDTVKATENHEMADHKAILACAIIVGGTTRNPFAAGLVLLGGYYLVTHPSTDLGRLPDWIGQARSKAGELYILAKGKANRRSKPKDCPTGTVPIDQVPELRGDGKHEKVKQGVGAGPADWTGITPDGQVVTSDEKGNAVIHPGHWRDYLP